MGKADQHRSVSKGLPKPHSKSGKSTLVLDDDELLRWIRAGTAVHAMQRSELKRRPDERKSSKSPDEILDELLACTDVPVALEDIPKRDGDSHPPTSVVSDADDIDGSHSTRAREVLPRPRSCPRVLGEGQHSTRSLDSLPTHDAGSSVTKGDLMEMQRMLLGSFSQFGQTIQAINTRMDVIDLDKVAMAERLDQMQAQLTLVQEKLSTSQHSACGHDVPLRVHPPGVVQPMPGKLPVDVARSTSPCVRQHVDAPPVPQFGDGASIFTAQRGRSPPRVSSMPKLGQDDLHARPPLLREDTSVHSNIVRIASVPPYLRHYDGADDGTLLRRMVNIGPFAQNLLLDELRTHLLDQKLVPLDAE
eukprot:2976315-Amphidinium_carterae.1